MIHLEIVNERSLYISSIYILVTSPSDMGIWPVIIFSLLILPLVPPAKGTFQAAEDSEEHESCSSNLHFGIVLNNNTMHPSPRYLLFIGKEF